MIRRRSSAAWTGLIVVVVVIGALAAAAALPRLRASASHVAPPRAEDESAALSQPSRRSGAASYRASELVTPELEDAVARGLDYLASIQDPDSGAFGSLSKSKPEPRIAVTALAALAFLAHGDVPGRGKYGRNAERAISYLVQQNRANPRSVQTKPIGNYFTVVNDTLSRMHGHGYATLAAAEAMGMYGVSKQTGTKTLAYKQLRESVRDAVKLLENTQSREGGWYYEPEPGSGHENSITITVLQALRSARMAGVDVKMDVINRALDYVIQSQNKDGSFSYALRDRRTSSALTAAAIATLHAFGKYDDPAVLKAIDKGIDYLARYDFEVDPQWYWYNAFYTAQALWFDKSTRRFDSWFLDHREKIIRLQDRSTGAWSDVRPTSNFPDYGSAYSTAFACLILQIPYDYLPIMQR